MNRAQSTPQFVMQKVANDNRPVAGYVIAMLAMMVAHVLMALSAGRCTAALQATLFHGRQHSSAGSQPSSL
jgi:hypothetical protein